MDWIERFLHVSPDAGSGTVELGIIAGAAVAVAMIAVAIAASRPRVRAWCGALRERLDGVSPQPLDRLDG